MKSIGTLFVGMTLFQIVILGIAKFVVNVGIGENGTAKIATGVHMESVFLASIAMKMVRIQISNINPNLCRTTAFTQTGRALAFLETYV